MPGTTHKVNGYDSSYRFEKLTVDILIAVCVSISIYLSIYLYIYIYMHVYLLFKHCVFYKGRRKGNWGLGVW